MASPGTQRQRGRLQFGQPCLAGGWKAASEESETARGICDIEERFNNGSNEGLTLFLMGDVDGKNRLPEAA